MKKVLILSAPIGSGHKMTAAALVQELQNRKDIEVYEGDVFSFMPAWIGKVFLFCYLKVLQLCPWLYKLIYSNGSTSTAADMQQEQSGLWLRYLINRSLLYLGREFINKIKPDIVIATHATPLGIMSLYKEQRPDFWLGAVVPDYKIHPWWLYNNVDTYFIADEGLRGRFPAECCVQALGLPLREGFRTANREACRRNYGFAAKERVILLMGGGDGLLPMESIAEMLVQQKFVSTRLIIVAGNNIELEKSLREKFGHLSENILLVFGFRKDVPELMLAADVLISKGGAVTAAEALACGINYIIYKPLPGQEMGNASFLAANYGVNAASNLQEIVDLLQEMQSEAISGKIRNIDKLTEKRWAAVRICDCILAKK